MIQQFFSGIITLILAKFILNDVPHAAGLSGSGFSQPSRAILKGPPISPGKATGIVRMVDSPSKLTEVKQGEILVFPWSPEYRTNQLIDAMKRASAIVTDRGGRTSHVAIVSRELGKPCVIAGYATQVLKEGQVITVDGSRGIIYSHQD